MPAQIEALTQAKQENERVYCKLSDGLKEDLAAVSEAKQRAEGRASEMEGVVRGMEETVRAVEDREAASSAEVVRVTNMFKDVEAKRGELAVSHSPRTLTYNRIHGSPRPAPCVPPSLSTNFPTTDRDQEREQCQSAA